MLSVQEFLQAQKEAVALAAERGISYEEATREIAREKEAEHRARNKERMQLVENMASNVKQLFTH